MHQTYFKSKPKPKKRRRIRLKSDKKESLPKLIKKLDDVFAIWIKNRDNWTCVTCGKCDPGSRHMHAGHYILRRHKSVRFDERNVNAQCSGCNTFQYGNMDVYALFLIRKYGIGILEELEAKKNTVKQWTREEIQKLITKYSCG